MILTHLSLINEWHLHYVIILGLILLCSCKDHPSSIETPLSTSLDERTELLNQIASHFKDYQTHYNKEIIGSNGFDKIWIYSAEEFWKTDRIFRNDKNGLIHVFLTITSNIVETYEECDNFYSNNCKENINRYTGDTLTTILSFDIDKSQIYLNLPNTYSFRTDSINVEDYHLLDQVIDYDFFTRDSSIIKKIDNQFEIRFDPVSYDLDLYSKSESVCSFWEFRLSNSPNSLEFNRQNHKVSCAPKIQEYFNTLFPITHTDTLVFEREIQVLSGYGGELYGTTFESTQLWNLREINFSKEKITQEFIFDVTSHRYKIVTRENYNPNYEPEITVDTLVSESKIILDYHKNNVSFVNESVEGLFEEYSNFSIYYDLSSMLFTQKISYNCIVEYNSDYCSEGRTKILDLLNLSFVNSYWHNESSNYHYRSSYWHGKKTK